MRVDRRRTRRRRRRTCGWGVTHRKRRAIHVVCVCLCRRRRRSSSSSSSSAVSLAALAAPLVRMKSSAVQVPAALSCSSAVPPAAAACSPGASLGAYGPCAHPTGRIRRNTAAAAPPRPHLPAARFQPPPKDVQYISRSGWFGRIYKLRNCAEFLYIVTLVVTTPLQPMG